ncbi:MAG: hypothetical protein Kow0068_03340 [Marinilabiliales bacterium]
MNITDKIKDKLLTNNNNIIDNNNKQFLLKSINRKTAIINDNFKDKKAISLILDYLYKTNVNYLFNTFMLEDNIFYDKISLKYHQLTAYNYINNKTEDYNKFIIITQQRSGSNFLVSSLNYHSEINMFSEILNKKNIFFGNYEFKNISKHLLSQLIKYRNKHPKEFITEYIFKKYPDLIKSCGFKLFVDNLKVDKFKNVIENLLINDEKLKIIRLNRNNKIAQYYSLKKARLSGFWSESSSGKKRKTTINNSINILGNSNITISEKEFIKYLKQNFENEKTIDSLIKNHETLQISYEDLNNDYNATMDKIQSFLNVRKEFLISNLDKQNKIPLNQILLNYDNLVKIEKDFKNE